MYKFTKTPPKNDQFDFVTVKISLPIEVNAETVATAFREFLLACGFQPETVKEVFNEE